MIYHAAISLPAEAFSAARRFFYYQTLPGELRVRCDHYQYQYNRFCATAQGQKRRIPGFKWSKNPLCLMPVGVAEKFFCTLTAGNLARARKLAKSLK